MHFLISEVPLYRATDQRTPLVRRVSSGSKVSGPGFRVQGSGFRDLGSGFSPKPSRDMAAGSGFRISSFELRVSGVGFWFSDLGFRVGGADHRKSLIRNTQPPMITIGPSGGCFL